jgi:hypothetical protein
MSAFITKFLPATDCRGARIKATSSTGTATVPYDHAEGIFENHRAAANALADRLGAPADRKWAYDTAPCGSGYVFIVA